MAEKEYIEREATIEALKDNVTEMESDIYYGSNKGVPKDEIEDIVNEIPAADVVEVKHGEWVLEVHSFYVDNWDESIELCVYILASCSKCGEEHNPKQVFSKRLYAPEDADDFRFDQEYEKSKALEEFKQKGYKFQNYCPNCGAKMDGKGD